MSNLNISEILKVLSKMNKEDLEQGLSKANEFLKKNNKEDILKEIDKKNNS